MTDSDSSLLSWHAAHIRSVGYVEFGATILRTRSKALHDVLAYVATDDNYTVAQLRDLVADGTFYGVQFRNLWLATLGRVVIIQALEETDTEIRASDLEFGMTCLKHANNQLPRIQEHQQFHRLEIEILKEQSRIEEAREVLDANEFLEDFYYGYLRSDLENPVISRNPKTYEAWLTGFNRPFVANNLSPIKATPSPWPKFNNLSTDIVPARTGGPKVSVLMTSYKPDREDFFTAVNSILNQSWRNLELIIIDDASPEEFEPVLAEAEGSDPRVRVIQMRENGGTYRARNAGIAIATGTFITGQDSDDWSHPERIATQVDFLLENPAAPGVIVEAIRTDNALVRTFPGRIPHSPCEVSFMVGLELAREIGGYLETRKGADGEFRLRVEKYTNRKVEALKIPLYLIRIGHDSLSRGDFKPGWSHPARRAFWNSSNYWHENSPTSYLRLTTNDVQPIPVPDSLKMRSPQRVTQYDVVYVGDWRTYSSTQRAMLDEIEALRDQGNKIGILQQDSIMCPSQGTTRLSIQAQRMINTAMVQEIVPGEKTQATLVVVHDPTIIQFMREQKIGLTAELVIIKPDMPPSSDKENWAVYLPKFCDRKTRRLFRSDVLWTANDPEILRHLQEFDEVIKVDHSPAPVAFRAINWLNSRPRVSGTTPIIGRHAANYEEVWPESQITANELWPMHEEAEIRVLGDARACLRKYRLTRYPSNWIVYRDGEIHPEAFMSGLDFFIYYPADAYPQSFCREALEASASGALVILPPQFQESHGNTAIYSEPASVGPLINHYFADRPAYHGVLQNNRECLKQFTIERRFTDYIGYLKSRYQVPQRFAPESHA